MKTVAPRGKARRTTIGRLPVVILPLEDYARMVEDLEMLSSKTLPQKIEQARQQARKGQVITLAEVQRKLLLS